MDYTIQKGDTIAKVTKLTGKSWQELKALNPDAVGRLKSNGNWFFREGAKITSSSDSTFAKTLKNVQQQKTSQSSSSSVSKPSTSQPASTPATVQHQETVQRKAEQKDLSKVVVEPAPIYPAGSETTTASTSSPVSGEQTVAEAATLSGSSSAVSSNKDETVVARWYGKQHQGKTMANGKPFNMYASTIAHKDIPLGTKVLLENPATGQKATATVTDRGPYVSGRDIDVSYGLAERLSLKDQGVGSLVMKVL